MDTGTDTDTDTSSHVSERSGMDWEPDYEDVMVVTEMLQRAFAMPLELVALVLDAAEYWVHTHARVKSRDDHHPLFTVPASIRRVHDASDGAYWTREDCFVLRTTPIGLLRPPVQSSAVHQYTTKLLLPCARPPTETGGGVGDTPLSDVSDVSYVPEGPGGPVLTSLAHPCRKIVFTLTSHDQGWGGDPGTKGTYKGSYTWFDVGLESFGPPPVVPDPEADPQPRNHGPEPEPYSLPRRLGLYPRPDDMETRADGQLMYKTGMPDGSGLQRNKVAMREYTTHKIVWHWTDGMDGFDADAMRAEADRLGRGVNTMDGTFVRSLRVGDVITVWARSRFQGWVNHVRDVAVDVYWAL